MAIKGKKKPKARSPRVVTAGPRRPAYVPPKVPLFQRTGAKFLVALIAEAIVFSLLIGFGEQSEKDRQQRAIAEFTSLIEASLGRAGEVVQPFPGGAQLIPQLSPRLAELQGENPPDAEAIEAETEQWKEALTRAADGIVEVQVPQKNLDPGQRLALSEIKLQMERNIRIHAALATQLAIAAQLDEELRDELAITIQDQAAQSGRAFATAYGKLQEVRRRVGLSTTATLPGGGFPAPPAGIEGIPEGAEVVPVEPPGGGGNNGGGGQGGGGGGNG